VGHAGSYLPGVRGTLVECLLVNLTMSPVIGTAGSVWIPRLPREASSAETRAMVILSGAQVRGGVPKPFSALPPRSTSTTLALKRFRREPAITGF